MSRFTILVFCLCLASFAAAGPRKKVNQNDGKIVGGTSIDISAVPYQVSLQKRGGHFCGGSIIGSRHILTAAHCLVGFRIGDLSIRVGSSRWDRGGEVYKVRSTIVHPAYNHDTTNNDIAIVELESPIRSSSGAKIMPWRNKIRRKNFDNDIALLELETPLKFNANVKGIPIARTEPKVGETALVSGWGATVQGGDSPLNLQAVKLPVMQREVCQRMYERFNTVTDKMWCAGYAEGGKDSCQGDSGGPAVVNGRLAGVVSWGSGCAKRNKPGVYTLVAKYHTWIAQYVR